MKNKKHEIHHGLNSRRPLNTHTKTNQKQAAVTEGSMEGRCNKQDAWGKCDTIILGAL
jgi:hypothetical protein